ncbi:MAG: hypothetical protein JKY96_01640 [Phycisphaerales bacterium]|nr:hypothetical protein [Phycisphaerales bacterium]
MSEMIENQMPWIRKLRLRVFAVLVALTLAAIGIAGLASLPALPVVGVTITLATMVVNKMTAKLGVMTCSGCGTDLTGVPTGAYGAMCTDCGVINTTHAPPVQLAKDQSSNTATKA